MGETPKQDASVTLEPQEIQAGLDAALGKFFGKGELTDAERDLVMQHRQKCIDEVKKASYKFSDIGSGGVEGYVSHEGQGAVASSDLTHRMMNFAKESRKRTGSFMEGKPVVDLGPGPYPETMASNLSHFMPSKYVAVDLEPIKPENLEKIKKECEEGVEIESVGSDFLEYLMSLQNESAVIVSSAALNVGEVILPANRYGHDYLKFIAHEIARVTPKGGVTYHYEHDRNLPSYLEQEGFQRIKEDSFAVDDNKSGLWLKPKDKVEK